MRGSVVRYHAMVFVDKDRELDHVPDSLFAPYKVNYGLKVLQFLSRLKHFPPPLHFTLSKNGINLSFEHLEVHLLQLLQVGVRLQFVNNL
jgi:hypothetical protein